MVETVTNAQEGEEADQHVSEWEPLSDETINREPGDSILVDTGWMRDKVIAGRPISVSQADWARYLAATGDWETLRRWAEVMEDD